MDYRAIWLFSILTLTGCAGVIQPDPVYRETEIRQARPRLAGEEFDPQESIPSLRGAFSAADVMAERAVGNVPRDEEFIAHFWKVKKQILRKEFGISWMTPAELNPRIKYASYGQPELTELEKQSLREQIAKRLAPAEIVHGFYREFEGVVWVTTSRVDSDTNKIYRFTGHDETWTFLDEGVMER
jgi:hypothetical protein